MRVESGDAGGPVLPGVPLESCGRGVFLVLLGVPLELLAGFYQLPGERQYHVRPGLGWFFDFQMPAIERLCNTGAELVSLPGSLLAGLDRKEGERNGS